MTYNQKIPPFKWFILENFPYIEEDFDALTNWQLFCKLGKEMNKIIEKTNLTGEQVEQLTTAFNELKSYIDDYFENLDVQDEIDNKLDEMAEQGVLTDIIAQYLQLAGVLAYDNKQAMKQAQNLADGSIAKTLGKTTYQDGQGAFFKVRQIQNTDVVDDENIIALYDPDLVAEKIPYSSGYDLQNQISTNTNAIADINNNRSILLSDSYFDWSPDETIDLNNRYWKKFFDMEGITDYYAYNKGGIGFYQKVDNENFLSILQNHYNDIQNKNTIKYIFVFGGYNDAFDDNTTIQNINDAIDDFVAYCKINYPNAQVIIGEIGYDTNLDYAGTTRRNKINNKVIPAYCNTTYNSTNSYIYLPNLNYCLHNKDYMSTDGIHPNTVGHNALANAVHSAYHNGFEYLPINEEYVGALPADGNTQENTNIQLYVKNDIPLKTIRLNNFTVSFSSNYPTLSEGAGTVVGKITNSKTILPVYDIPFDCTILAQKSSDNTYELVPGKLSFTQDGSITLNAMKLNNGNTGWDTIPDVKYVQVFSKELTCSMNVL